MEVNEKKILLEKYPYLSKISDRCIFETEKEYEKIQNSKVINVGSIPVFYEYLKNILTKDEYFEKALSFIKGEIFCFNVAYIKNGDAYGSIMYNKLEIIYGLDEIICEDEFLESDEALQRYQALRSEVSFKKFCENNKNGKHIVNINGAEYSISLDKIFSFVCASETEYDNILDNSDITEIFGMQKEYFIYAVIDYFNSVDIMNNSIMEEMLGIRLNQLINMKRKDVEYLDYIDDDFDTLHKQIKLNEDLENHILSKMPDYFTDLEKAIYIYIKMCKTFVYDDEYYVDGQTGDAADKRRKIEYISGLSMENNEVVCFEFNIIYAYFLDKLRIKFKSDYHRTVEELYGKTHVNLSFRYEKFIVFADSVTSILYGDMMKSKLNQPLVGLECVNQNDGTKNQFMDISNKVYEVVASECEKQEMNNFDDLVSRYESETTNIKPVSLEEKIFILTNIINDLGFRGIDSLAYVLQLRKILFTDYEKLNNFGMVLVRSDVCLDKSKNAEADAILFINKSSYLKNVDDTFYYYYKPRLEITEISKDELQGLFDAGVFSYINKSIIKIPGIKVKGVKEK